MFYYNRVYNTCPLYTHVTPIWQCVDPCNLFWSVWSMFVYNTFKVPIVLHVRTNY